MNAKRRYRSVPLQRRWMNDLVHFGLKSHVMGYDWKINIANVVAARGTSSAAINWAAVWMKALSLVGQRRPELRSAYLPFPWARIYVHPQMVCTMVIERTWRGASALFFQQFNAPEKASLRELDASMRRLRQVAVEEVGSFRRMIRLSRPPVLIRRLIWSIGLNWSGPLRAKYFGISAINPFPIGGRIVQTTMPVSFMLYFGLIEPNGDAQIQVFYDHRIMDGVELYKILRDLEVTMNRDIAAELKAISAGASSAAAVPSAAS